MIYKKWERYDHHNWDPSESGSTILTFYKEYLQQIVHKADLNDLDSYKNIFGQRGLVYHKKIVPESYTIYIVKSMQHKSF